MKHFVLFIYQQWLKYKLYRLIKRYGIEKVEKALIANEWTKKVNKIDKSITYSKNGSTFTITPMEKS